MLLGPTLGIFTLAMVFPWANSWGALGGVVSSYAFAITIGLSSAIEGARGNLPDQALSLSTLGCPDYGHDIKNSSFPPKWDSWKKDFENSSGKPQKVNDFAS